MKHYVILLTSTLIPISTGATLKDAKTLEESQNLKGLDRPISGVVQDRALRSIACATNEYDKDQYCSCKDGEAVTKIESVHHNKYEDRKWTLTCTQILQPSEGKWEFEEMPETKRSKAINMEYKPEENWFLVGFKSR